MKEELARKPLNDNPADAFLNIILCKLTNGGGKVEYVTWLHNSQDEGCYSGHYFTIECKKTNRSAFQCALDDFNLRSS